jgi:hypothetical protein
MEKTETQWVDTKIDMDSVDWKGNPIRLEGVPAIQNTQTKKILVYPQEVAKAEVIMFAKKHNIDPLEIPVLLMLYAKVGAFRGGVIHSKFRVNKALFLMWKDLGKEGLGEALPHDEFEPKPKGPIPQHLWDDFKNLERRGTLTLSKKPWGTDQMQQSVTAELTDQGQKIASELWDNVPDPFKEVTMKVKGWIITSDPETIRKRVHREYPEYKESYTELDVE